MTSLFANLDMLRPLKRLRHTRGEAAPVEHSSEPSRTAARCDAGEAAAVALSSENILDEASPEDASADLVLSERNKCVLADVGKKAAARKAFCSAHAQVLRPFLDEELVDSNRVLEAEAFGQPSQIIPPNVMRDYQLESLSFFAHLYDHGVGGILGDEMGLGKTLQSIAFFAHLRFDRRVQGPFLVVCPLSVLDTWFAELGRWCPRLTVLKMHTTDIVESTRLKREMMANHYDVTLTTYDIVKNKQYKHAFSRIVWRVVVADEGHIIKNGCAQITHAMRTLRADFRILLTGTPVQNNLIELHALLEFINPGLFSSNRFAVAYEAATRKINPEAVEQTRCLLEVIMMRRLKIEVEKDLPPKHEVRLNCPLSPMQLFWYRRLLVKDVRVLESLEQNEVHKYARSSLYRTLSMLIAQLRKVCNHPYLFEGAENRTCTDSLNAMVAASGKLALLDRLLVGLRQRGHRVVIFSQYTRVLDIIQDYMTERGWRFLRFDGSTTRVQRSVKIHQFQTNNAYSFMLMSTRSGGLGVNLQCADTVILFDSDWNPQADRQAMARVHRVGQKKPVWVYRLVAPGTVEERILQRAETKLVLDAAVLAGGYTEEDLQSGAKALYEIIRTSVVGLERRALDDDELNMLLDRSQSALPQQLATKTDWTEGEPLHDTFTILGKNIPRDMKQQKTAVDIARAWHSKSRPTPPAVLRSSSSQSSLAIPNKKRSTTKLKFCLRCQATCNLESCSAILCHVSLCTECLASEPITMNKSSATKWNCPQHYCAECGRKPAQVGGALFRCFVCPLAWCEACLPGGLDANRTISLTQDELALGYYSGASAMYIICAECGPHTKYEPEHSRRPEPQKPLDLSAYVCIGDVDETFAFLG